MTNDLDFLASIETLVAALGRQAASLRHNPLMTQHNLDSIPLERLKGKKCDGEEDERVRKAERVILEEMRWASHARGRQKNKNLKSPGRPEVRQFPALQLTSKMMPYTTPARNWHLSTTPILEAARVDNFMAAASS